MRVKKIILFTITALLVVVLVGSWVLGVFRKVSISERIEGGYKLAGIEYTGSYNKAGEYMEDAQAKLKNYGIMCKKGFGIYYDDPKTTPGDKCHSYIGCILEASDYDRIAGLVRNGFKIDSVAKASSAVAEFPIITSLSYIIGPMKVYPAFTNYFAKNGYKPVLSMEIYDMDESKILFIMQYNAEFEKHSKLN